MAGAPGSGKSTLLPLVSFGTDYFNADEAAAARNGGSYRSIAQSIRAIVNTEFANFIEEHIKDHKSFAVETTLRTDIALQQAHTARQEGFRTAMFYIATESVFINLNRVAVRALGGGHSAPEATLKAIHEASYKTFTLAIESVGVALDQLSVFDNSGPTRAITPAFQMTADHDSSLQVTTGVVPLHLQPYYSQALART